MGFVLVETDWNKEWLRASKFTSVTDSQGNKNGNSKLSFPKDPECQSGSFLISLLDVLVPILEVERWRLSEAKCFALST